MLLPRGYHEPGFILWVKQVLKKRDRQVANIKKLQITYSKKGHKFGIKLPESVEQAFALDAKNGYTLLADTISKEFENVRVAFEILSDGKSTTWYLTSKWRNSDVKPGLWQEAT